MTIKYTMLFELVTGNGIQNPQQRIGGWSESWYDQSPNPAYAFFATLQMARAGMLPATARIVGQRYQRVDPVGTTSTGSEVYPGNPAYDCDIPQMALFCRCRSAGTNFRPMYLRAIPDLMVTLGEYTPTAPYFASMAAFFQRLLAGGWRFRGRDLTILRQRLLAVVDVGGQIRLISENATGWVAGDIITVTGVTNGQGVRVGGRVRVLTPIDDFTFPVQGWTGGTGLGGFGVRLSYIYPTVTAIEPSRIVTRRVGRPFTGYRGRRSTVRR